MSAPVCVTVCAVPDRARVSAIAVGELDLSSAGLLRRQLDELLDVGWLDVLVDLRKTTFADSAALHALLDAHDRLAACGGALTVLVAPGQVADLLSLTGVDRRLSIVVGDADFVGGSARRA